LLKHPEVGRRRGKGKKENGSYVGTLHPQQYRSIFVDPPMDKNSWRIHQFKQETIQEKSRVRNNYLN